MDLKRPIAYTRVSQNKNYPHSSLEASMARTNNPKYASYFGDGSGRDKYIIMNNGGLTNEDKKFFIRGAYKNILMDHSPKPQKNAVSFTYHSDGTGRDSYVISNSGGLVSDYNGSRRADIIFKDNLRHSIKPVLPSIQTPYAKTSGGITQYLNWPSKSKLKVEATNFRTVKNLIRRISPSPDPSSPTNDYKTGYGKVFIRRRHSSMVSATAPNFLELKSPIQFWKCTRIFARSCRQSPCRYPNEAENIGNGRINLQNQLLYRRNEENSQIRFSWRQKHFREECWLHLREPKPNQTLT